MKNHSDKEIRDKIIGLGEKSVRKSYYPQLKQKIKEVENLNRSLEQRVQERTEELNQVITEQQHTNLKLRNTLEQLHNTQAKLVESEKMAALGALVAGVAHEINTPVGVSITGVSYFLELCKKIQISYENNQITRGELNHFINSSSDVGNTIFNNLKKTSQLINSFKQIAINSSYDDNKHIKIKEHIEETVLSLYEIIKNKNITIQVDCEDSLLITGNPSAYTHIITHLIMNSYMHGFENKTSGNINIKVKKQAKDILLIYTDNGKGVPKENLAKIFDPFFTTNRIAGASGLGLNVIYNLVTNTLNGTIECSSEAE